MINGPTCYADDRRRPSTEYGDGYANAIYHTHAERNRDGTVPSMTTPTPTITATADRRPTDSDSNSNDDTDVNTDIDGNADAISHTLTDSHANGYGHADSHPCRVERQPSTCLRSINRRPGCAGSTCPG